MDTSEFTFVSELPTSRRGTVSNIKTGKLKYFPVGDFEAQKVGNAVYVRFVGE